MLAPDKAIVWPQAAAAATAPARADAQARVPELDALRGFAAIGILALHTIPRFFFWAWSCVDLFFVLSGFLITGILLANAGSPKMLWSFYVRRALRIWPVYFLALAFTTAIFLLDGRLTAGAWPHVPGGHWLTFVFLQYTDRYLDAIPDLDYIWYFAHSWSLAVEEQFYLVWPFVFLLLRPRTPAVIAAACLGLLAAGVLRGDGLNFHLLATRVDGLLLGMVLAYAAASGALRRVPLRAFVAALGIGLALVVPYVLAHGRISLLGNPDGRAVEVTAFCLIYAAIVGLCVQRAGARWLAPLRLPLFVHLGRISFAIYMYQVPLGYLALAAVDRGLISHTQADVIVWIATLAAAQLSYLYFERPILALKQRFPYRANT